MKAIMLLLLTASVAFGGEYTVKKGDSLWRIAKREYGNGERWRMIYLSNRRIIGRNPNKIRPGQKLTLPKTQTTQNAQVVQQQDVTEGYKYWKTVTARVTAYCPCRRCCGRFANGRTSTGSNAWRADGVGVYPKAIPYGTMVKIPGVGFRKADDTGPAMRRSWRRGRYHIDLRHIYHWKARRWGRPTLSVELYKKI